MWLQGLHASFLGFQILVAWEFLIKGIELHPEVAERLQLTDINRQIYPYLTVWNLVLHVTYLITCAAEDVLIAFTDGNFLTRFKKKFSKNRSFVFETLVFPGSLSSPRSLPAPGSLSEWEVTMGGSTRSWETPHGRRLLIRLVVSFYWGITLMDPLYLFPGPIEDLIPAWINFLIHSGVGFFAVGEVIVRRASWSPRHGLRRLQTGCTILTSYAIVICIHRYLSGSWIYPFIKYLSWPQIIALYLFLASMAVIYYHLGYFISHLIHGSMAVRSKQT